MARRLERAIGRPEDRDTHEVCTNFLMYGCHVTNTLQTLQPLPPRPNNRDDGRHTAQHQPHEHLLVGWDDTANARAHDNGQCQRQQRSAHPNGKGPWLQMCHITRVLRVFILQLSLASFFHHSFTTNIVFFFCRYNLM